MSDRFNGFKITDEDKNWGEGRMFYPYQESDLVGQVLTFAESLGLPEKQEKGFKDTLKHMLYGFFNNTILVPEETAEILRKA
jgi:hypothetical protein